MICVIVIRVIQVKSELNITGAMYLEAFMEL